MRIVCGCFEVKGLTFKPREAIFGMGSGTLGHERTPESALCSPGRDLQSGFVSACFVEPLNKTPRCLAPSHRAFSEVKLRGRGPWGIFQPPPMRCTWRGLSVQPGMVLGFLGDA